MWQVAPIRSERSWRTTVRLSAENTHTQLDPAPATTVFAASESCRTTGERGEENSMFLFFTLNKADDNIYWRSWTEIWLISHIVVRWPKTRESWIRLENKWGGNIIYTPDIVIPPHIKVVLLPGFVYVTRVCLGWRRWRRKRREVTALK